ncbi:HIT family protein [Hydrogenimonas urashimensis]|uniref:HIT family protein n=1 Tax=Hydrogenimonas urashimensis TaxID=2740515 RepID=UPI0019152134|nr:HIT family protein [Hydrogenimonas urashimensis]
MIYEDDDIILEWEASEIPWIKIFTREPFRELTECPDALRGKLWRVYEIVERAMIEYFSPYKINMASFGNYLPRVHIHVMARFENDSFFPEPMWGEKQRDGSYTMPSRAPFEKMVRKRLKAV